MPKRPIFKRLSLQLKSIVLGPARLFFALRGSVMGSLLKYFHRFWTFREPEWSVKGRKLVVPQREMHWTGYLNAFYWVGWLFSFLLGWLVSRPYANLGPSLPSILVIGSLITAFIWERNQGSVNRVQQYKAVLAQAAASGDQELAILANRRLLNESPDSLDLQLQRALLLGGASPSNELKSMIWKMATTKKYGPAAYWLLANEYKMDQVKDWTPAQHSEFRVLIDVAYETLKGKQLDDIKLDLASYLAQHGARQDAVKILKELVTRNPEVAFTGLSLAYQEKDEEISKEFATLAVNHFSAKLNRDPSSVQIRLNLAKSLVILEREQEAAQRLQEGLKLTQASLEETEQTKNAIGEVLIYYVRRLTKEKKSSETLLQRLTIVTNAIRFAPDNPNVINAVVDLLFECDKNDDKQVSSLRNALLDGAAPEAVHFMHGTLSLLSGDLETARSHLEIARATGLNMPGILNNLAMAMLDTESVETLEKALELSTEAVREMPDHPYLRDTRGRVLVKLKRLPEAIPELEFALRAPELAAENHKLLSEVYQDLGQADLAAGHKQRYDSLVKKNTKE